MKLAPDRKKFMDVIGGSGDVSADMEKFCTTFAPLLAENHKFLVRITCSIFKFEYISIKCETHCFAPSAGQCWS